MAKLLDSGARKAEAETGKTERDATARGARRSRVQVTRSAEQGRTRTHGHIRAIPAQFTEAELKLLQALVYQECGMHFDERRTHFLQDRLQRRLKECHLDSFYSYYRLLISKEGKAELARLLENLTVNETSFFRNKAQLELFHKHILEELLRRKQAQRDYSLRIWSAGCSTGQEPYTLAMLVADSLAYYYLRNPLSVDMPSPKPLIPPPWKVEILASDISYSVLRDGPGRHFTPKLRWRPWTTATACATSTRSATATQSRRR